MAKSRKSDNAEKHRGVSILEPNKIQISEVTSSRSNTQEKQVFLVKSSATVFFCHREIGEAGRSEGH